MSNKITHLFEGLVNIQINPGSDYWFLRKDCSLKAFDGVKHVFNENGIYLKQSIPPVSFDKHESAIPYTNSEIYNSASATGVPHNVISNPFTVDGGTSLDEIPIELYDFVNDINLNLPYEGLLGLNFYCETKAEGFENGSRGWGFWNTNPLIGFNNIAWFFQYDSDSEADDAKTFKPLRGMWAWCQNGYNISLKKLHIGDVEDGLDEDWHRYQIRLNAKQVLFFVDGKLVHMVDDAKCIPTAPMAFHNWVDNAVYIQGSNGLMKHRAVATGVERSNYTRNMAIQWGIL